MSGGIGRICRSLRPSLKHHDYSIQRHPPQPNTARNLVVCLTCHAFSSWISTSASAMRRASSSALRRVTLPLLIDLFILRTVCGRKEKEAGSDPSQKTYLPALRHATATSGPATTRSGSPRSIPEPRWQPRSLGQANSTGCCAPSAPFAFTGGSGFRSTSNDLIIYHLPTRFKQPGNRNLPRPGSPLPLRDLDTAVSAVRCILGISSLDATKKSRTIRRGVQHILLRRAKVFSAVFSVLANDSGAFTRLREIHGESSIGRRRSLVQQETLRPPDEEAFYQRRTIVSG